MSRKRPRSTSPDLVIDGAKALRLKKKLKTHQELKPQYPGRRRYRLVRLLRKQKAAAGNGLIQSIILRSATPPYQMQPAPMPKFPVLPAAETSPYSKQAPFPDKAAESCAPLLNRHRSTNRNSGKKKKLKLMIAHKQHPARSRQRLVRWLQTQKQLVATGASGLSGSATVPAADSKFYGIPPGQLPGQQNHDHFSEIIRESSAGPAELIVTCSVSAPGGSRGEPTATTGSECRQSEGNQLSNQRRAVLQCEKPHTHASNSAVMREASALDMANHPSTAAQCSAGSSTGLPDLEYHSVVELYPITQDQTSQTSLTSEIQGHAFSQEPDISAAVSPAPSQTDFQTKHHYNVGVNSFPRHGLRRGKSMDKVLDVRVAETAVKPVGSQSGTAAVGSTPIVGESVANVNPLAEPPGDDVGVKVFSENGPGKRPESQPAEIEDIGEFSDREEFDDCLDSFDMRVDVDSDNNTGTSRNIAQLDAEEIYDHLLRHPNSPCTNAAVALLCELVVDLKSTITFLRNSTESVAVNGEPGEPSGPASESMKCTHPYRTRRSTAAASRNRDKKHQPSYLVDLKADVRRLMHEFLEYPEKDLIVPTPAQLKQYKEKDTVSMGPSLHPLVLDLASKGASLWNKKAAKVFGETFKSLGISECDDKDLIEAVFLTHVDYLRKLYLKQSLDVEGKVDATERAKRKAQYARRKELRERRFKNAFLPYQQIPQMKAIRATLSTFPAEVVSEDEREVVDEQEHYLVVRLDWRSGDAGSMCEILDALHMASHFTANDQPRPGRFNHPRTQSTRVYTGSAPPALPANFYRPEYLSGLNSDDLADLNIQPKVDILFPARIMRIAARFRHVKCRNDIPLSRSDSRLDIYVDGKMYRSFVE